MQAILREGWRQSRNCTWLHSPDSPPKALRLIRKMIWEQRGATRFAPQAPTPQRSPCCGSTRRVSMFRDSTPDERKHLKYRMGIICMVWQSPCSANIRALLVPTTRSPPAPPQLEVSEAPATWRCLGAAPWDPAGWEISDLHGRGADWNRYEGKTSSWQGLQGSRRSAPSLGSTASRAGCSARRGWWGRPWA